MQIGLKDIPTMLISNTKSSVDFIQISILILSFNINFLII
jgi:hypothetical protein